MDSGVDRREAKKFPESKYKVNELASAMLSSELRQMYESTGTDPEKRLGGSVFILNGLNPEQDVGDMRDGQTRKNLSTEEILDWAKMHDKKVAFYYGGIRWTGKHGDEKQINPHLPKPFAGLANWSSDAVSPEEQAEGENELASLDGFASAGYDVIITLDPKGENGKFVSSLRADMLAKKFFYDKVGASKSKDKTRVVAWSDGAFKDYRLRVAAFTSLFFQRFGMKNRQSAPGFEEEVFKNPTEAKEFLEAAGGINSFWGGTPADSSELAIPYVAEGKKEVVSKTLRDITNKLVYKLGHSEVINKLVKQSLLSRLLEIGAANKFQQDYFENFRDHYADIKNMVRDLNRGAKLVNLLDLSGEVVNPANFATVAKTMQEMYGDSAVCVQTEEEKGQVGSDYNIYEGSKSQHREIGRAGVMKILEAMLDPMYANAFDRYKVVDPKVQAGEVNKSLRRFKKKDPAQI